MGVQIGHWLAVVRTVSEGATVDVKQVWSDLRPRVPAALFMLWGSGSEKLEKWQWGECLEHGSP